MNRNARRVKALQRPPKQTTAKKHPIEKDVYGADARSEHAGSRYFERDEGYWGTQVPIIMGFRPNEER